MNAGWPGSVLDLAAQPMDVDVDRARLARVVVAPDLLEQLVAGEDLAGVSDQEREQLERLGLDRQDLAVAQQSVAAEVGLDPPEVDDRRRRHPTATAARTGGTGPGCGPSARAGENGFVT